MQPSNTHRESILLIDGQVVDTYGRDFTYKDVWAEFEEDKPVFYELCFGAKPSPTERVTDPYDYEHYLTLLNEQL